MDPQPKKPTKKIVKDDAYAQALLQQVNAEFAAKEAQKPELKHFVSKKTLIYLVISIILTILGSIVLSVVSRGTPKTAEPTSTQQLFNN